jgi:hypothetical protein
MQDMNLEVHYYKNFQKPGNPCKELCIEKTDSNTLSIKHFEGKVKSEGRIIDWNTCKVFYVGFTTNRSRTLKVNVEVADFNE